MVHDGLKVIFIHIPRTAGNSISAALRSFPGGDKDNRFRHCDLRWYYKHWPEKVKNYFIFTSIRNPYEMVYSHYYYKKMQGKAEATIYSFNEWVFRYHGNIEYQYGYCFKPALEFIRLDCEDVKVHFMYYEKLQETWEDICKQIGIKKELDHLYPSEKPDYKKAYNNQSIEIIKAKFADDFYCFGYDKEFDKGQP
jgi:hypothetical protein